MAYSNPLLLPDSEKAVNDFPNLDQGLQLESLECRPLVMHSTQPHQEDSREILSATSHRPWPLPNAQWTMTQRWNDLLFAHWPVAPAQIAPLLPANLVVDTFDGAAWVGVVPFWMDQIRMHRWPEIPGVNRFPELNLRTYVRESHSNLGGVYFFSLDAGNPLAVAAARLFFKLPYYWSKMRIDLLRQPGVLLFEPAPVREKAGKVSGAVPQPGTGLGQAGPRAVSDRAIRALYRRSGWRAVQGEHSSSAMAAGAGGGGVRGERTAGSAWDSTAGYGPAAALQPGVGGLYLGA